jgi:hypothetical protein
MSDTHGAKDRKESNSTNKSEVFPPLIAKTLSAVCDIIIPADEKSGSASDAEVVEFLQYVASESNRHFRRIVGSILWLNAFCSVRYGAPFLDCASDQQLKVIDLIAFRRNAEMDPSLSAGIEFFAFLRRETLNAFYTSRMGITDLDYRGNQVMSKFLDCPIEPDWNLYCKAQTTQGKDKLEAGQAGHQAESV